MRGRARKARRAGEVDEAALTDAGQERGFIDQLQIARLKKRKLRLKDQIAIIEDELLPDIIA